MFKETLYPEQVSWRRHQLYEIRGMSGEELARQLFDLAEEPIDVVLSRLPCSDAGNGQRFASRFFASVMYVRGAGWHRWIGTNWTINGANRAARRLAQQVGRLMAGEIEAAEFTARASHGSDQVEIRRRELRAWLSISAREPRVFALLQAAKILLQREPEELDANPRRMTVRNGTLQALDDGSVRLRRHRQWDLITTILPVDFGPGIPHPEVLAWLERLGRRGDRQQGADVRGEVPRS